MSLFGPKSKEYGDLNRKSINELNTTVEEQEKELQTPFAGSAPGLVPASDETTQAKYLRGDGEWGTPAGGGGGTEDYEELANKPAIDGTTLDKNSTAEGLGLAKKTDIPAVPTKTSDLTNDSGFITDSDVPTKTSELTNDSGFVTDSDVPTKTSELTNDSGFITDSDVPSKTSELTNDSGFITDSDIPGDFDGSNAGLVPVPSSGDEDKFLKADGSWDTPASGGDSGIIPGYIDVVTITTINDFIAATNKLHTIGEDIPTVTDRTFGSAFVVYAENRYHVFDCPRPSFNLGTQRYGNRYLQTKIKTINDLDVSMGTKCYGGDETPLYSQHASLGESVYSQNEWRDDLYTNRMDDPNKEIEIFVTAGSVIYTGHGGYTDYVDNIVEVPLSGTYFYSDAAKTQKITPEEGKYYLDIPTGDIYYYDGTDFVLKEKNTPDVYNVTLESGVTGFIKCEKDTNDFINISGAVSLATPITTSRVKLASNINADYVCGNDGYDWCGFWAIGVDSNFNAHMVDVRVFGSGNIWAYPAGDGASISMILISSNYRPDVFVRTA